MHLFPCALKPWEGLNNEFGRGTVSDLKKDFDRVNHAVLLTKLNHYRIRDNLHEWFKSYLSLREQFVIVSSHDSISQPLTCDVPQGPLLGSLLRPLLFLLKVNDLPSTSSLLPFHLFPYDTNLYLSRKNQNKRKKKSLTVNNLNITYDR